jgi:hypothetical protein
MDTGDITVVGWTMSHSKQTSAQESANIIVDLDGDITVLTHGWQVRSQPPIRKWVEENGFRIINSQFTIITKFAPLKVRTLIASDGIYISEFTLDTKDVLGEILTLWAIDLPSSVSISKISIANRVRRLLPEDVVKPDLVIGDFNMTNRSTAISTMFPALIDASTKGSGLLASYPMEFPIYHIDHILFNKWLQVIGYRFINPRIGRHRIQIAEIKANRKE